MADDICNCNCIESVAESVIESIIMFVFIFVFISVSKKYDIMQVRVLILVPHNLIVT